MTYANLSTSSHEDLKVLVWSFSFGYSELCTIAIGTVSLTVNGRFN